MKSAILGGATASHRKSSARSALLVFVTATLTSSAVFAYFVSNRNGTQEAAAFAGVGAAAGAVLSLWAAILAVRSFRNDEAVKLSAAVCAGSLALSAAMVLGIYSELTRNRLQIFSNEIFNNAVLLGLPFLLPLLVAASFFAIPIARVRAKRIEAREKDMGRPEWNSAYRFKRTLRLYAFWLAITSLPFLPHTFFFFIGATADGFYHRNKTWRVKCADKMPAFIGNQLCMFLEMFPDNQIFDEWQSNIIEYGHLSPTGVRSNLNSKRPGVTYAAAGHIKSLDSVSAREIASEVLATRIGMEVEAGYALGKHGTREQIVPILERCLEPYVPRDELIFTHVSRGIVDNHRDEFFPQFDALIQSPRSRYRDAAFKTLGRLLKTDRAVEVWIDYLKLRKVWQYAAENVGELDCNTQLAVALRALEVFDDEYLFDIQINLRQFQTNRLDTYPAPVDMVQKLLNYLNDYRIQRRRFATFCLAALFRQEPLIQRRLEAPEGDYECSHRAEIRAFAQKWLETHPETGGAGK